MESDTDAMTDVNDQHKSVEINLENEERSTARIRKQTEKGSEYSRELKEKKYRNHVKELQKEIDELDMTWTDINDIEKLRNNRLKLEESRKALESARNEYAELLDSPTYGSEEFESLNKQAQDLRKKIGERIFELEKMELSSVRSRSTRRSSRSSVRSCKSNASNQRIQAVAELAKREIELKFAKLETQMKLERQRKECEIEELQRAKEFERAKAEAEAIVKAEKEDLPVPVFPFLDDEPLNNDYKEQRVKDYVSTIQSMNMTIPLTSDIKETILPSFRHEFREGEVFKQSNDYTREKRFSYTGNDEEPLRLNQHSTTCEQRNLAEIVAESMQAARMPPPNLTVFSGNPIEWPTWKSAFENIIEKRAISSSEKILYLLQYLSGPPKKVVEGYQFVSSPKAYEEAKRILERRFGHPSVVAEAFRSKLENWQRINPRDGVAMREYADFLKTCQLAMESIEDLETLSKEHENKKLLRALPSWAHQRWGGKVKEYQQKYGDSKFPPFHDFVTFVTDLADVQCLPVLSGLDKGQQPRDDSKPSYKSRSFARNTKVRSLATSTAENEGSSKESPTKTCRWCKGTHDLESCQTFKKKPMSVRKQFIIKGGLCFRCLEHGHLAKANKCSKKIKCKICERDHPTCLHVEPSTEDKTEEIDSKCTSV